MSYTLEAHGYLKAVMPDHNVENGRNLSGKKELVSAYSLVGIDTAGQLQEILTCRCWMGHSRNASTVYASIWIRTGERYLAGHGQAGGYGYHKESAAIADAISSAGVELLGTPYWTKAGDPVDMTRKANVSGAGEMAIRSAFAAIGAAIGYSRMILCTH